MNVFYADEIDFINLPAPRKPNMRLTKLNQFDYQLHHWAELQKCFYLFMLPNVSLPFTDKRINSHNGIIHLILQKILKVLNSPYISGSDIFDT